MQTHYPGVRATWLCLLLAAAAAVPAHAQELVRVDALTPLDQQYMDQQRQMVRDLSLRQLGSSCCDSRAELPLMQRLLDTGVIRSDQRRELQALGIVLGDLLAEDLGLRWVIYEDDLGRSRALRLGDTDNFLFPVTMISRRREAGNEETVQQIYDRARAAMQPLLPPAPYQ